MAEFDGILIVSDYDGTWYFGDCDTTRNTEAVEYFNANGGKFAISSGRCKTHLAHIVWDLPVWYI